MSKVGALWALFRQGNAVADPKLWKERQIKATVLAGVIMAAVNALGAFGYALPVDTETANAVAAGIIAVVNVVFTVTTTDKVGISTGDSDEVAGTGERPEDSGVARVQAESSPDLRSEAERMLG